MPTNQYDKNFAGGVGANTLTPAAWAALTTLLSQGFQPGIALAEQMNTILRQMSTFMAGISDWVELKGSLDQLDNGVVVDYFNAFKSAMDNAHAETRNLASPVGTIVAFAGAAAPTGWFLCNGQLVSRTGYSNLWNVIGTTYGAGDGSTTFALPDLRGEFLRGLDAARGVDPGRALGSAQGSAFAAHNHLNGVGLTSTPTTSIYGSTTDGVPGVASRPVELSNSALARQGLTSTVGGATETRPRNVAINFIIRY